ncbi:hypothetical protein HDC30_002768 [Pseudomonas sp. JAI115]|nr:hypothetical protein [Pseudomonas sp. JAI115]
MKAAIVCFSLLALPLASHAIDAGPASAQQQETEGWLQLQARNKVPSPTLQTVTPAERELAMQRWLKSYQHDIPVFFDQDQGGKVDSGSGGERLKINLHRRLSSAARNLQHRFRPAESRS